MTQPSGAAGGAIEAWHLCDSGSQEKQAAALARDRTADVGAFDHLFLP